MGRTEERRRAVLGAPQHMKPEALANVVREVADLNAVCSCDMADALHAGTCQRWWESVVKAADDACIYRAHVLVVTAEP